jgi:hypothetical protein
MERAMRLLIVVIACLTAVGPAGFAHAAQIASPAIFGSHDQDVAQCVVINGGTDPINVTVRILNESGGAVDTEVCNQLPPFGFCSAAALNIPIGVAFACTATAGSVLKLRGTLTIQENVTDSSPRPIRSAPLR